MPHDPKAYLLDIVESGSRIQEFVSNLDFESYRNSPLVRAAVERHFEIIGEALGRLKRIAPGIASQIADCDRIVAFRNVIAHGYDIVSDELVWQIVQEKLPVLLSDAKAGFSA